MGCGTSVATHPREYTDIEPRANVKPSPVEELHCYFSRTELSAVAKRWAKFSSSSHVVEAFADPKLKPPPPLGLSGFAGFLGVDEAVAAFALSRLEAICSLRSLPSPSTDNLVNFLPTVPLLSLDVAPTAPPTEAASLLFQFLDVDADGFIGVSDLVASVRPSTATALHINADALDELCIATVRMYAKAPSGLAPEDLAKLRSNGFALALPLPSLRKLIIG